MKTLMQFLVNIDEHIARHGFDDVMDLIPYFEELQLSDWEALLNTEDNKPVNTTIYQSEYLRIVLIPWQGNKQSSVHGHAEGGGLIKVLDGHLEETRFDPEDHQVTGEFHYEPGAVTYIHDMIALHQVKNPDMRTAISLHMYTRKHTARSLIHASPKRQTKVA